MRQYLKFGPVNLWREMPDTFSQNYNVTWSNYTVGVSHDGVIAIPEKPTDTLKSAKGISLAYFSSAEAFDPEVVLTTSPTIINWKLTTAILRRANIRNPEHRKNLRWLNNVYGNHPPAKILNRLYTELMDRKYLPIMTTW